MLASVPVFMLKPVGVHTPAVGVVAVQSASVFAVLTEQ
jgi:hypothetical protein